MAHLAVQMDWSDLDGWLSQRNQHLADNIRAVKILLREQFTKSLADEFWKAVLFNATEFPSKYRTRYVSIGIMSLLQIDWTVRPLSKLMEQLTLLALEGDAVEIRHDHVWSRDWLRRELSKPGIDMQLILREYAWGCTITKHEHDELHTGTKGLEGWQKYRAKGIQVFDMLEGRLIL